MTVAVIQTFQIVKRIGLSNVIIAILAPVSTPL